MKLKLKENPREWQKLVLVLVLAAAVADLLLFRRRVLTPLGFAMVLMVLGLVLVLAAARPRWFRGFYRRLMTVSFYVGQFMGGIMLTVFFLLVLTPLGLMLRAAGKDLLKLKKRSGQASYWERAGHNPDFERMF